MRHHQADPADDAGGRDARRGDQRRRRRRSRCAAGRSATPSARASSSGSDITFMRQRSATSTSVPSATGPNSGTEIGDGGGGEAAEQPERHRGKLVVGIGEIFHEADAGAEQRADHDAGEHQHQDRIARAHRRADQVDRRDRDEAAHEGEALDAEHAEREIDADHGAERRARRRAEDIGRHQRIAEQALERGAGDRERRADQHRREHARPAHLQDHVLDRERHAGCAAGELGAEHVDHVGEPHRIAADREREREPGDQDARARSESREAGEGRMALACSACSPPRGGVGWG